MTMRLQMRCLRVGIWAVLAMGCGRPPELPAQMRGPAPSDTRSARVERGRYIVNGPGHCFQCHSEVDWKAEGAPPRPGRAGAGVAPFPEENLSWLAAPNLTPDPETGTGRWTDDQFARAIRQGIGGDGRTLFPLMPYSYLHQMSDEDTASVIAYLRTLDPVRNPLPPTRLPPPLKEALRPLPTPGVVPEPDRSSPVAYGKYLTTLASCTNCHTPLDPTGRPIAGLEWAGGMRFKGPFGELSSVNLTPAPSGIPHYDEKLFIQVMRTGNVGGRKLNSLMPWGYYRNMTDGDLKAIFAYLRTLPPVKHCISNTEPPRPCKRCGGTHGLGEYNEGTP